MNQSLGSLAVCLGLFGAAAFGVSSIHSPTATGEKEAASPAPVAAVDTRVDNLILESSRDREQNAHQLTTLVASVDKLASAFGNHQTRYNDFVNSANTRIENVKTGWKPPPAPAVEIDEPQITRVSVDRKPEALEAVERLTAKIGELEVRLASMNSTKATKATTAPTARTAGCSSPSPPGGGGSGGNTFATQAREVIYYEQPVYYQQAAASSCSSSRNRTQGFIDPRFSYSAPFANGLFSFGSGGI